MALRGDFVDPGPEVNFLTDWIRPTVVIDGTEHPLGLLIPVKVSIIYTESGHHLSIQAYDQCWLLQTNCIEDSLNISSGTKYTTVIDGLLDRAGIGLSLITPSNLTMTRIRNDWMPGTNCLKIINDLLDEMNYGHIWFDLNGYAVVAPDADPQNNQIRHTLDDTDIHSLLIRDANVDSDYYSTPNVFICYCCNFEQSPMIASAINMDTASPISVPRRGRKIYSISQVKDVASQNVLQAIADRALNRSRLRTETIKVSTGILPDFGINENIALQIDGKMSVCIERGWTMQLVPGGTMTHTMERTMANYD